MKEELTEPSRPVWPVSPSRPNLVTLLLDIENHSDQIAV